MNVNTTLLSGSYVPGTLLIGIHALSPSILTSVLSGSMIIAPFYRQSAYQGSHIDDLWSQAEELQSFLFLI